MPGPIQSIERSAAAIRLLARCPRGLRLLEMSNALQLPKGTIHGILRTLSEVGFVEQHAGSGRYQLAQGLLDLTSAQLDANELRLRSINWADPLAARTGEAVRVGQLSGADAVVVHYVFRPDDSQQSADVGAMLPGHATAIGKVLLAYNPGAEDLLTFELPAFTGRTVVSRAGIDHESAVTRSRGYAVEYGEYIHDQASIAVPIYGYGRLVVAAVAIHGSIDRLCQPDGTVRAPLLTHVRNCARSITAALAEARSAG